MADVRIGISGWRYEPWRGDFYPTELTQKNELYYASRQVSSIEINGSFYATQSPKSYKTWAAATPDDFVFSVKCPRYITHIRRLKDVREPLSNFFASGVLHLDKKLGAFLWQFPPSFRFDEERVEEFFKMLPTHFKEAVALAEESERYDAEYPKEFARSNRPLHHAMEVRNHSFENPDFIKLLRKYNVALVLADTAGKWPYMEDITADFMYLRLHGDEELYASGYDKSTLRWWADRIELWEAGRQASDALTISEDKPPAAKSRNIYVYFDNDMKVRAPYDARTLMGLLGQKRVNTEGPTPVPELGL